jgi:hypothetical protein
MFIVDKEEMHLRGTLAYVSADNLGAQYLGGFKQGSQSHRKCRECMGINDQIQSMVRKTYIHMQYGYCLILACN